MIHIDKDGTGYLRGDKAKIVGYIKKDDLVEFVWLEGHKKGSKFVQPREGVRKGMSPVIQPNEFSAYN